MTSFLDVAVERTTRAFVAIGANQGDVRAAVRSAMAALAGLPSTVLTARSSLYLTAPVDADGCDYLNAVVELQTGLQPVVLLAELQRIESEHGRERPYQNAPRTLDLDLLLCDDIRMDTPALTLPHPRMHQRAFVLRPLAEIAPALIIPGRGEISMLLAAVSGQCVERLEDLSLS